MNLPFKTYVVGGAVRDKLLGLPIKDRDWVVVGANPEQLLQAGFTPVGKDFPVFLHPNTHEEYALARTERKVAHGYHGFQFYTAPDVTLLQDLARRDLTINAMAEDEQGNIIDPYGGQQDLAAGVLRHIGTSFAEDPVRILRVARFAARFNFSVAPETLLLMQTMVQNGEVDALVAERVWQEMARALMENHPSTFFDVLHTCGALVRLLPELDEVFHARMARVARPIPYSAEQILCFVDRAARERFLLPMRFATLVFSLESQGTYKGYRAHHGGVRQPTSLQRLCTRLRVPSECRDLARITAMHYRSLHEIATCTPTLALQILKDTDALRRPKRFHQLLAVCAICAPTPYYTPVAQHPTLGPASVLLDAVLSVDAARIAQECPDRTLLVRRLEQARLDAITQCQAKLN